MERERAADADALAARAPRPPGRRRVRRLLAYRPRRRERRRGRRARRHERRRRGRTAGLDGRRRGRRVAWELAAAGGVAPAAAGAGAAEQTSGAPSIPRGQAALRGSGVRVGGGGGMTSYAKSSPEGANKAICVCCIRVCYNALTASPSGGAGVGEWRSPAARYVRDVEAPGSNPGSPTSFPSYALMRGDLSLIGDLCIIYRPARACGSPEARKRRIPLSLGDLCITLASPRSAVPRSRESAIRPPKSPSCGLLLPCPPQLRGFAGPRAANGQTTPLPMRHATLSQSVRPPQVAPQRLEQRLRLVPH